MKKLCLFLTLFILALNLSGCAKKINGIKTYDVKTSSNYKFCNGTHNQELLKVHGTTSAPNGYQVLAVNNHGKFIDVGSTTAITNRVQIKNGKFTGYIDPLKINAKSKKGSKLALYFFAVESPNSLNKKDKKALSKQASEKYTKTNLKLSQDPTTVLVKSKVQASLGKGAIVNKRSKTVYTITPKKDSDFEDKVSKSMYGNKKQWSSITNKINQLSKKIKTPNGKIALVLINPEHHKKFLLVSINGKAKVDAISSGTTNSKANNASNINSSPNTKKDDDSYDDFTLGMIFGLLLANDDSSSDASNQSPSSDYSDYSDDNSTNYDDYGNTNSNNGSNVTTPDSSSNDGMQQSGGQQQ